MTLFAEASRELASAPICAPMLSSFWAIPCHFVGSSVTAVPPQVRPFYASAANNNNAGLWVSTFKLDSGDFIPDDQAFSFALYGTP